MTFIQTILNILLLPGLAFTLIASIWLAGVDRVLVARMQRRVGPSLLQPLYDVLKCLGKETIIPRKANEKVFLLAPVVGLASVLVTAMFLPVGGVSALKVNSDMVVILYLLTLASVTLIVGASASGSPFAGVGLSREMVAMISYELPLVLVMLTVGRVCGKGLATFSLSTVTAYQAANGPLLLNPVLWPAAIAMLFVIPCEVGQHPFDIDEAETEICEGVLAEYSGRPLAQFKMMHNVKMYVMSGLFCAMFLNISTGFILADILIYCVACTLVTFVSMSVPHAVTARFRVEQVFKFYWTVVTGCAALSLILVWIGL
ncbi:MAG: NADH-quinone oxidoreductase subunit H [Clostridia bacterium]|nr:NADH-quinone oxidoreductase subunit H [Clostridia bacterium]